MINKPADKIDRANEAAQKNLDAAIEAARSDIPPGNPGDCDLCGEWTGRLIDGACAPCRDEFNLK